jgi:hypothetical protein
MNQALYEHINNKRKMKKKKTSKDMPKKNGTTFQTTAFFSILAKE